MKIVGDEEGEILQLKVTHEGAQYAEDRVGRGRDQIIHTMQN